MVRFLPKTVPPPEDDLREIFKKYDTNGDGRLSRAELTEAFRSLHSRLPAWRAYRGLKHADANRDGFVSEEEMNDLLKYAKKHGYAISK